MMWSCSSGCCCCVLTHFVVISIVKIDNSRETTFTPRPPGKPLWKASSDSSLEAPHPYVEEIRNFDCMPWQLSAPPDAILKVGSQYTVRSFATASDWWMRPMLYFFLSIPGICRIVPRTSPHQGLWLS